MKTNRILNLIGIAAIMICFVACKKSTPPTVKIYDNSISVSYTSANVTGEVTDEGSSPVTDRGFIYGKQGETRQDTMYCGNGGGEFPTRLTGLEPNTTYNCTAFARNDAGMACSGKATFTTLPMAQSDLTTMEPTNIGHTHVTCGGYVNSDGGSEVTERGVCWATTQNPTTNDSHLSNGSGTGEFSVEITGLTANTSYHVRAYAVNEKGTAYGDDVTFKTQDYSAPIVTTMEVTGITTTTAMCGGEVTSNGGATITARGVCYSTNGSPTINDSHTVDGTGTGSFTSSITGLSSNKTYYVRAYATNIKGTSYGEQITFKTKEQPPTGAINGKFSVSGTTQVWFSQGNLQYKASTNKWRFAESQLDYIGSSNSNISSSYSGWIDLFGWGTGNNPTNSSTSYSDYNTFIDWGTKPITNGGNVANKWRTLTSEEWKFLMFNRTTASGIRYARVTVNGVKGVVILPDDWDSTYYTLITGYSGYSTNTISMTDWMNKFEANGAVFLPAAGMRTGISFIDGTGGYYSYQAGLYWTSSFYNSAKAYALGFNDVSLDIGYNIMYAAHYLLTDGYRYYGYSVRLVTE